ncbi:MAG: hypothetical protein IKS16_07980 [Lachnospiraceae bacterium]|nr:hypothetical protein [Lachnospiraceae bacterium]
MIGSFIPNHISNSTVAGFLDLLRKVQRRLGIGRRHCRRHVNDNRIAIDRLLGSFGEAAGKRPASGYLEKQNNYRSIAYGRSDMAYAGCEIIAVYNALLNLDMSANLRELIEYFEHDGMVFSGRFGTAPYALRDYLKGRGLKVETIFDPDGYDEAALRSKVSILMLYNDSRSIFRKIHTICITKDSQGLTSHNMYGDGRALGPYPDVTHLIRDISGGFAKGIVMFGINV